MDKIFHLLIMYTMLVLMLLLFQRGRKDKRSFYLAAYAFIEVLTNSLDSLSLLGLESIIQRFPILPFITKPITLLWVPFFNFYVRACFSHNFKVDKKQLFNLLPFGMALLYVFVAVALKGEKVVSENMFRFGTMESWSLYYMDLCLKLQYIFYNALFISMLIKKEKLLKLGETKVAFNVFWLRFMVYGYAFVCLGAIITFIAFHINPYLAVKINGASVLFFFLFFFIIFFDSISAHRFSGLLKPKNTIKSSAELNNALKTLKEYFNSNSVYLDANLSLAEISNSIQIKERLISKAINSVERRNFKDFINEYRIKHAIELLKSGDDKPIFEVMYESGFNTKAAFNTAFKKFTGKTPSEYRDS